MIELTIIIPFKDSIDSLKRLFQSIPKSNEIEIIVIENTNTPHTKKELGIERDYKLLWAESERYAGGARNVGLSEAKGKWIIFADSDDFFTKNSFNEFFKYTNSDYDVIYFGCESVYDDTLKISDRHIIFNDIIKKGYEGKGDEVTEAKLHHVVPWAKMIRRDLIEKQNIKFEEVIAANDIMFSVKCAIFAKNIKFERESVYVVTVRKGSLSNTWNKEIIKSRYIQFLKRNKLLKINNLGKYQISVMFLLYRALKINLVFFFNLLLIGVYFRQNLFIGYKDWIKTMTKEKKKEIINNKYIVK